MKSYSKTFFYLFIFWVVIASCSPQKNKFLNRQYHGLNTKYNVIFNGKEALSVGEEILIATIEDDFFEIIKVDPILLSGERFDENTIVPGFEKAEEKAVKAIQKHSMDIKGIQRNANIDDAYLLLGKARYYDRRFFPAIEAFNFLLENNVDESVYIEGRIWREKTNIRLQNNKIAINNLRPLARQLINKNPFYGQANATLAQAFINLKEIDSAKYYMIRAANHEKNLIKKVRYSYIAAQLCEKSKSTDQAIYYYNSIVEMNWQSSRSFWVNAKINLLRLSHQKNGTPFIQPIKDQLDVYENKRFSHTLNRALGMYYSKKDKDSLVEIYLLKSLNSPDIDRPTQKANFRDLASLSFKNKKYLLTGAYLDSLIPLISVQVVKNRTIRERENLSDVIFYENQFQKTDSLLSLLKLNESEQIIFFENYLINKRKLEYDKLIKIEETKRKSLFKNKPQASFYFYNPSLVLKGKQYFASTWGKRPNIDNWRNKTQSQFKNSTSTKNQINTDKKVANIEIESVDFYMNQIPTSIGIIDSLKQKNYNSALKLGLIYKEKYYDKPLAIKNLKYIIENQADSIYLTPALYHIYKVLQNDSIELALNYKNQLIKNYPESIYAKVLKSPNNYEQGELITPESTYLKILNQFFDENYNEVISMMEASDVLLAASKWEPKMKFIKAQVLGRLNGRGTYKKELTSFIEEYPNSDAAMIAKKNLEIINKKHKEKTKTLAQFKWVFPYKNESNLEANRLIDSLNMNIIQLQTNQWKLTKDYYNTDYQFIIIHGIKSKLQVDSVKQKLPKTTFKLINTNNFVALSAQFREMFVEKTWFMEK